MRSRHTHALVGIALAALLAIPLGVWGATTTPSPDDDIPGVPLPSVQPVTGNIDAATGADNDDVFKVRLQAGKWFWAHATAPAGTDFDLYLFGAGKRSVRDATPALASSESQGLTDEMIRYRAPAAADGYLNIYAYSGAGTYAIRYGFASTLAKVSASAPSTCAWAGSANIAGAVTRSDTGAGLSGEPLTLYHRPAGTSSYTILAQTTSRQGGSYAFSVKPTRQTAYRVRHLGSAGAVTLKDPATLTVTPKAYISGPKMPTSIKRGVTFTVYGYLNPRHKPGEKNVKVRFYQQQSDGKWVWKRTVGATNADHVGRSGIVTKYRARIALPAAGAWRARCYIEGDSLHAATYTPYVYRTVLAR